MFNSPAASSLSAGAPSLNYTEEWETKWRKWPYLSITCQLCGSAHVFFLYHRRNVWTPTRTRWSSYPPVPLSNFLLSFYSFHVSPLFLSLLYHRRNMPTAYLRCLIKNTQPRLFFVFFNWHSQIPTQSRRLLQLPANLFRLSVGWRKEKIFILKILFIYFGCASLVAEHRL